MAGIVIFQLSDFMFKAAIKFYRLESNEFIEIVKIDNISSGMAQVSVPQYPGVYRVY